MKAFHTLRTKNRQDYQLADFEIFTAILSALEWKKYNGEIFLYTDKIGAKFFNDIGILEIWDGVDTVLDELDAAQIDENIFWAGAKIFALSKQNFPCVMIDLDFIVWQSLDFARFGNEIAVIHREDKNMPCYPDKNFFHFKDDFKFPPDLNWELNPCNSAFVYFGDKNFVEEYSRFAFEFMRFAAPAENQIGWDLLPYMVFIEQRWLVMCAEKFGVPVHNFSTLQELFGEQNFFTHIWGHKQFLRENPAEAEKFCRDCAGRIAHDFPNFAAKLATIPRFKNFFTNY